MKYLDEYRNERLARSVVSEIRRIQTRPWVIMEVCGGQTHSIVKHGIDFLLPEGIELVHGPGCPVCVTPLATIDKAHAIAARPEVIFCSFGDMLRVPGTQSDLFGVKARGGDVRIVYSPLDALALARAHPGRRVVFFGIGFETTAPANAMALITAKRQGLANFSMLASHVLVPPAIASILQASDNRVQAFLGPGHVCAIVGFRAYTSLAARYRVPIAITGFEPVDLLRGVLAVVRQLERGTCEVENAYARNVSPEGNEVARAAIAEVFEIADRNWRGIGAIPKSGYRIADAYRAHDADRVFDVGAIATREPEACISGLVLRGIKKPGECPAFGRACTPATPLGATMVSAEGACAAYFQHRGRSVHA
jgi:hydrogenase expression/formation protein HypD